MSFNVPSFEDIRSNYLRDLKNQQPEASVDADSDNYVRATAVASAVDGLYAHQRWIVRQLFPDTADPDYLELHAALRGLKLKAATSATGSIAFQGSEGAVVPSGTEAKAADGTAYVTTTSGVVGQDGTIQVAAKASTAGAAGNLAAGTVLTLTAAPAGVQSTAAISEMLGGTDAEDHASLLARLLEVLQDPPAGGNDADYKRWAKEVDGVTQAWVYPLRRGLGTVDVAVSSADGLPSQDVLDAVQAYIDVRRPTSCKEFWAVSPTAVLVDIVARIRVSGVTLEQAQARIETALAAYFVELEPGDTVYASRIAAIISDTPGVVDLRLDSPAANVDTSTALPGGIEWPRLGVVTVTLLED